jgi:VCBS repeat-containing protein
MAAAWINEFHYDNAGTDIGEFVEIAAPAGTDLTGWTIVLYNGSNGLMYGTKALSGIVSNQQNGFGTISISYPTDGIQNGSPDAIALVNNLGQVVEFISYEGAFTAASGASNGPAAGMTATTVSPTENGSATGTSIGRVGTGDEASDFTWALIADDTPGGVNVGQTFTGAVVNKPGAFSIADATVVEGNGGSTPITFTVSRGSDSNVASSVSYTITLPGGATGAGASDFVSPALSGTLNFAANEFSKTITLNVAGDTVNEADETFTVALSAPSNGAALADGSAVGTIQNDDAVIVPGAPFINEIHYDNAGTDAGEAIEIAAPAGTSLAGWSIVLYSVSTGATMGTVYNTRALSGIVADQDDGYGTITFTYPVNGIQNGAQDGLALVDPNGNVVQFLSYEGSFVAQNGPAAGLTSTDLGASEDSGSALGFSLQLAGSGASAADFHWVNSQPNTFGAVNTGQDFIGPDATGQVRIGDSSVVEGDSGQSLLVFTVTRAGGLGQSAGVDWLLNLVPGGADAADLGAGQPLSGHVDFGVGVSSVTISIAVAGDTVGEGNDMLNVLLANPTGNIAITDASAAGTILNDDPIPLKIYEIQGEGHATPYAGQPVTTSGIVTGVVGNGFYLQDPTGDGNARTSDAVFVFTSSAPTVAVGDAVEVRGTPQEFVPGADSLSITELAASNVTVQSHGNELPAAVLIGVGGVLPPTEIIENDGFTSYDPATDGLDFYESMEGMRVTIDSPVVVSNTTDFGETWVLASGGDGATGYNGRTGITISAGDYNPERIQIDATSELFAGYVPSHSMGDKLSSVTGIMSYSFNSYEVLVSDAVTVVSDVTAAHETTSLTGDRDHLTIGSYNVENFDPGDGPVKFDLLAQNIVYNLAAPDIIALQEVQDANGLNGSDPLSGVETAQLLIDAIDALGGPHYVYIEIAPTTANSTGGEPNGNIRNGFLYNADRVSYILGSATLIDEPAFNGSRKPLVADFVFNGETVRLVDVHFTSRLGSDPLEGANQPANDAGDASRTAQGEAVAAYVNNALATDPSLKLGVMGDFNGFYFEGGVGAIEASGLLTDLHRLNAPEERYSYLFDGNLQAIDHMLVTGGLYSGAVFDAVHINAEQPAGASRATDHDPIVGRFVIEHPNEAPFDLVLDGQSVDENAPAGTLVGTVSADDPDPEDSITYSLTEDAGGLFAVDPVTGRLTTTAPLDHEAQASYDLVVRATDPAGLFVEETVTVTVGDVNEAPTAVADAVAVNEDATTPNLWTQLLGNDNDPDAGATLSIASVNATGTLGSLVFDASTQTLRYVADNDAFDALAPGQTAVDTFTYTVTDGHGLTSTATVSVTVTGIADGVSLAGGNGQDNLVGTGGEDSLNGGNGNDVLSGQSGHDLLIGGNGTDTLDGGSGNDVLAGGNGNDVLIGGAGADSFRFGRGGGSDTILDFDTNADQLLLENGIGISGSHVGDVNGDGIADLSIAFTNGGGSVVLLGVSDFSAVDFSAAQAQALAGGAMIY